MNSALFKLLPLVAVVALAGCSVNKGTRAAPDSIYTYATDRLYTFAIANQAPAVFPATMSSAEKVRRLFGYPQVSAQPMGTFLATHAMASSQFAVDNYLNGKIVTYGPAGPSVDTVVGVGLGVGGLAGAAIASPAVASSQAAGADLRERSSSALCFIDQAKTPDVGAALIECQGQIEAHMLRVLKGSLRPAGEVFRQIKGSITVEGVELPEVLLVVNRNAVYAQGYAPQDLGGFKAHIFKIEFFPSGWTDKTPGTALAEDLAAALVQGKPANIFYRVSAAHDWRNRGGLEPIGIY